LAGFETGSSALEVDAMTTPPAQNVHLIEADVHFVKNALTPAYIPCVHFMRTYAFQTNSKEWTNPAKSFCLVFLAQKAFLSFFQIGKRTS
jgi:hypothetical protein